jgi:hypothetical protein
MLESSRIVSQSFHSRGECPLRSQPGSTLQTFSSEGIFLWIVFVANQAVSLCNISSAAKVINNGPVGT